MNSFLFLLILEICSAVLAGVLFRTLERGLAGLIAGSVFCLVGLGSVWIFYRQAIKIRYFSLAVSLVYLCLFSLPMLYLRASTPLTDSIESVFGVPMSMFHHGSELAFLVLVVFTILHWHWNKSAKSEGL